MRVQLLNVGWLTAPASILRRGEPRGPLIRFPVPAYIVETGQQRIREGDAAVRSGQFAGWRPALYGTGLEGTAVGIVGMGSLGRAIARRLSGFHCRLAYVDPGVAKAEGLASQSLKDRSREQAPAVIAPALLNHPRSVFTPHLGSAVAEVRRDIEMRAAKSILQALDGEQPEGAINCVSIDAR